MACHKVILGARSPVFNAMFVHNMTESQEKKIDIEDLDIETVKDMLKYMYAGKIENLNTRSPRLLEAADKYQLSELKEICEVKDFIFILSMYLMTMSFIRNLCMMINC